jgi:anti-sigma factor RsiW
MMTHQDIEQRLTDYALGLLPAQQEEAVSEHLSTCADCREAVGIERGIGQMVRQTLHVTTRPDRARLRRLMPTIPQQTKRGTIPVGWMGRLAPALAALLLIIGGLLLWPSDEDQPAPLFIVATATAISTNTPTATIVQEPLESALHPAVMVDGQTTKVVVESPEPRLPTAAPTPVAAANSVSANQDL